MPRQRKSVEEWSPEDQERRDLCDLLLKDFDQSCQATLNDIDRERDTILNQLTTLFKLEMMKIPKDTKEMNWMDYCKQNGGSGNILNVSNVVNSCLDDSICSKVDNQVSQLKSAMKTAKKRGRAASAKENVPGTAVRQSARKRNISEDGGGTATRSSSRTRTRGLVDTTNFETPANARSRTRGYIPETPVNSQAPQYVGMTPMITPKVDTTNMSLLKTVTRGARQNEVLFSLSGSPVAPAVAARSKVNNTDNIVEIFSFSKFNLVQIAKAQAQSHAQVPIGGGQTLNLPIDQDFDLQGQELDEEAIQQLHNLKARLEASLALVAQTKGNEV